MKNHFLLVKIFSGKLMNFCLGEKKGNRFIKGFTLVEIVVVIGIMAVLSSIIYSSFDGAKAQSRDQQRLADISTIQLGLELYFNQHGSYPQQLGELVTNSDNVKYVANIPTPPSRADEDNYKYNYVPLTKSGVGGTRCVSYHLWTTFERGNANLESKRNFDSTESGLGNLPNKQKLYICGSGPYPRIQASSSPLIYDVIQ